MRRAARIDDNQPEIVEAFESLGCAVCSLAGLGNGVLDLLVALRSTGRTFLVEVKDGKKRKSRRKLRKSQEDFIKNWPGPTFTVETLNDVVNVVNLMRRI